MEMNRITTWFRSHKGWIWNNLVWSGIFCFVGFIFVLIAHFIPADVTQLIASQSADNLQALGAIQMLACGLKVAIYMWVLAYFGIAAYANIYWIGTFIIDVCGLRKKQEK